MPRLAAYLSFPGNAREAFTHYHDVLGGELNVMTYDQMDTSGFPVQPGPNTVAHASLVFPGGELAGGDVMDEKDYPLRNTAYSLLYTLDDPDQARRTIDKLAADGGSQPMPFDLAPWGDWYGQVFDRFGVMWQISVAARASEEQN